MNDTPNIISIVKENENKPNKTKEKKVTIIMNVTANDDDNYYNNQSRLIAGYAIFFSIVFFCSLIISFHSFDVLVVCKECHTTIIIIFIIIIIKSDEREKNMSDLVTFNLSASKDFN